MKRDQLVSILERHPFKTHGIIVEFKTTNSTMFVHPYSSGNTTTTVMSRRLFNPLVEEVLEEVQRDLDGLEDKITHYGIWYYQLPGELRPLVSDETLRADLNTLRYAKCTKVKCVKQ